MDRCLVPEKVPSVVLDGIELIKDNERRIAVAAYLDHLVEAQALIVQRAQEHQDAMVRAAATASFDQVCCDASHPSHGFGQAVAADEPHGSKRARRGVRERRVPRYRGRELGAHRDTAWHGARRAEAANGHCTIPACAPRARRLRSAQRVEGYRLAGGLRGVPAAAPTSACALPARTKTPPRIADSFVAKCSGGRVASRIRTVSGESS
jgi:hypothetical protein